MRFEEGPHPPSTGRLASAICRAQEQSPKSILAVAAWPLKVSGAAQAAFPGKGSVGFRVGNEPSSISHSPRLAQI